MVDLAKQSAIWNTPSILNDRRQLSIKPVVGLVDAEVSASQAGAEAEEG